MTQENEAPELLPCPFCGGDAAHDKAFPGRHRIVCTECGAATEWMGQVMDCPTPPPERRKAAWNTRADLAAALEAAEADARALVAEAYEVAAKDADEYGEPHVANSIRALTPAEATAALLTRAKQAEARLAVLDDDQSLTVAYLAGAKDGRPRVKPLEFVAHGDVMKAECPIGEYQVHPTANPRNNKIVCHICAKRKSWTVGYYDGEELAKIAAQADYERRILDALEPRKPDTQPDPADVWDEAIEAAARESDTYMEYHVSGAIRAIPNPHQIRQDQ